MTDQQLLKETCSGCGLPFSDYFVIPAEGRFCWPCHKKDGIIRLDSGEILRKELLDA